MSVPFATVTCGFIDEKIATKLMMIVAAAKTKANNKIYPSRSPMFIMCPDAKHDIAVNISNDVAKPFLILASNLH
jgi:hypothetical protein